jgi:hypothetical protein
MVGEASDREYTRINEKWYLPGMDLRQEGQNRDTLVRHSTCLKKDKTSIAPTLAVAVFIKTGKQVMSTGAP